MKLLVEKPRTGTSLILRVANAPIGRSPSSFVDSLRQGLGPTEHVVKSAGEIPQPHLLLSSNIHHQHGPDRIFISS
jgi:hypothetical protein